MEVVVLSVDTETGRVRVGAVLRQFAGVLPPGVRFGEKASDPKERDAAIFASHAAALLEARDRGCARLLVLEDDCVFDGGAFPRDQVASFARALDTRAPHWTILLLGHLTVCMLPSHVDPRIVRTEYSVFAHAILYNVANAVPHLERLVARAGKIGHPFWGEGWFALPRGTKYAVWPSIAAQSEACVLFKRASRAARVPLIGTATFQDDISEFVSVASMVVALLVFVALTFLSARSFSRR